MFESFLLPLTVFKPSLAGRKVSRCPQHASLSLVKVRDYIIIHPTQEAEEDRWAGEGTSTSLHRRCLSIYVSLGAEKVPDRKSRSHLRVRSGSDVWFVVLYGCNCYFFFSWFVIKAADVGDGGNRCSH